MQSDQDIYNPMDTVDSVKEQWKVCMDCVGSSEDQCDFDPAE